MRAVIWSVNANILLVFRELDYGVEVAASYHLAIVSHKQYVKLREHARVY